MARDDPGRLHVLHIIPALRAGGMELAMARVIRDLTRSNMRHTVASLKGEHVADWLPSGVAVHAMGASPNDIRLPWRLARLIHRVRPTVIHARNWSAWPDVALARLAVAPGLPLIFSFHGLDATGSVPWRRRLASRVLAGVTSRIFTVCDAARQVLADSFGVPARRIQIIPNGVDTAIFTPAACPQERPGPLVVGTVGSLRAVKNQALLIRACAKLDADGMATELRIAGGGPEEGALRALSESLGVADRVRLLGHVADVPEFLRGLDVFALPSDSEGHPNALLEAMACGVAVVATRAGGAPEILRSGQAGRLVALGDIDGMARAIRDLSDRNLRRALGRAGRERVIERYSLSRMLEAYARLYQEASCRRDGLAAANQRSPRNARLPRVVMLAPLPPLTGGMASVADNLGRSMLSRKCHLTLISNGKATPEGRSALRGLVSQIGLLLRLGRTVLCKRSDLVHIHTCSGFTFWRDCCHALVARMLGASVVWHVHGGMFEEFLASVGSVSRAVARLALTRASAVIVLSRDWARRLKRIAPRARWCVVPNGVFVPELPAGPAREAPVFLFLGHLGVPKGARDLVRAASMAIHKGFQGRIDLAGGEAEPGDSEAVTSLIDSLACRPYIRLLGEISGRSKAKALASADCLVLPSYAEGLPMAIIEGMAHGLPVLTTKVGAIPEVLTDGVEGYLIEPGDFEALADRLIRLGADAALRRKMGEAGRRLVEQGYSIDVMVRRLETLYLEALRSKLRSRPSTAAEPPAQAPGDPRGCRK